MPTSAYTVKGMTCDHCVNAVRSEVAQIPGVTDVAVHLETGRVTVTSSEPLDDARLAEAVDEAGYELVG
ncbi:MAG: heavy metal transporter [Streptosporangiales bacterium]|nr:heavy metal transporter [Streptosporangiales bacterium]